MAPLPLLPIVTWSYKLNIYILYTQPIRFIIIDFCPCLLRHKLEEKLQTKLKPLGFETPNLIGKKASNITK